jgi:hypothetical protein
MATSRWVPHTEALVDGDRARDAAPFERRAFPPEQRDLRLIFCAGTRRRLAIATQLLHFVNVGFGLGIGDCERWSRPELRLVLQHKRREVLPYLEGDEIGG